MATLLPACARAQQAPISPEEWKLFLSIYEAVKQEYVEPVDDRRLMRFAIEGLLEKLDKNATYLDAERAGELGKAYGAIGLELWMRNGLLTVVSTVDGGPAAETGILPGDRIVAIDRQPTAKRTLGESAALLRGEPGSTVTLAIERDGERRILEIPRRKLTAPSTRTASLEPGYTYLRVSMMQDSLCSELGTTLAAIWRSGPPQGLILDLRNNPGGVLNGGLCLASAFLLPGQTIAHSRSREGEKRLLAGPEAYLKAGEPDPLATLPPEVKSVPVALLVNRLSAGGTEMVATALRENERVLVIGSKTYGNDSIQTVLPLARGGAIKLTTSTWTTPNGLSVRDEGMKPDFDMADATSGKFGDLRTDQVTAKALALLKQKR